MKADDLLAAGTDDARRLRPIEIARDGSPGGETGVLEAKPGKKERREKSERERDVVRGRQGRLEEKARLKSRSSRSPLLGISAEKAGNADEVSLFSRE